MIASQRKAHKFIWSAIAIVVPILMFFAIKNLDLTSVPSKVQTEQLTAELKENTVQIRLNKPFQSPSTLVYELNTNGKSGRILGQLEGVGNYNFSTSSEIKGIVVLDGIRKEELLKIEF